LGSENLTFFCGKTEALGVDQAVKKFNPEDALLFKFNNLKSVQLPD